MLARRTERVSLVGHYIPGKSSLGGPAWAASSFAETRRRLEVVADPSADQSASTVLDLHLGCSAPLLASAAMSKPLRCARPQVSQYVTSPVEIT